MTLAGAVLGFGVYLVLGFGIGEVVKNETGVVLDPLTGNVAMIWAPLGMIAIGVVSGSLPAMKAYRTEVARNLS